ncbi:MAG: helix-turn-helix domain-containing protein [Lachnospiraceae bacterium]
MSDKNTFGTLLQQMIQQAGITNTIVSRAVRYDISYISKWLSGRMLPSEKNIENIVSAITACIIASSQKDNLCILLDQFQCEDEEELRGKLQEALREAYRQSKKYTDNPDLSGERYYVSMPASKLAGLLKKQSGNTAAVIDLLSLDHETRLLLAGIKNGRFSVTGADTSVHYNMVINVEALSGDHGRDCVYDSIFLIHMLTSFSSIDFRLYNNPLAAGKFLYAVDGCYSASGMIFQGDMECIAVYEHEDPRTAGALYQKIVLLVNQEQLIFRKVTMNDMICGGEYIRSMISPNIRWLLGHVTELLLPDDLFEKLLFISEITNKNEIRRLHNLAQNVFRQSGTRIMIYESALSDLVVSGELDFFNYRLFLSPEQRICCLEHILTVLETTDAPIRLVDGGFSSDFQYITNPCLILSDSVCYVRLENKRYCDNILTLNDKSVKMMFERFYEKIWDERQDVVIGTRSEVLARIRHYKTSAALIAKME